VTDELGGAELLLQDLAGVLAVIAPGLLGGEMGFDPLVDADGEGLPPGGGPRVSRWPVLLPSPGPSGSARWWSGRVVR
jgi:hypothetical protein